MKRNEYNLKSLRLQGKQGDAWAQFTLGEMYRKGVGVVQNSTEAAKWYRRLAANSICRTADYLLGLMYLKGEGVRKDYAKAFKRFSLASTGGHRAAPRSASGECTRTDRGFLRTWKGRHGGSGRQPSRRGISESPGTGTAGWTWTAKRVARQEMWIFPLVGGSS
ncbi:MAG: sel1 repeat family protein [Desulfomonile tiedjei]|uniref:Sel1 repeat family protein n=1 Tax=Desulfomonile tiedjei TaxID=2358 RepID=A0A9D6V077_9BACT|nr:sel1 repeat family protein [Desulfomonile tiedjei]